MSHQVCLIHRIIPGILLLIFATATQSYETSSGSAQSKAATRQFTFAWPFLPGDAMAPRGGTTTGEGIELDTAAGEAWLALQKTDLAPKERDRQAILAMAGPYRASFDFIETVGFTEGYSPDPPYQSWGTEFVYVIANEPDFISLQHIMVIQVAATEGEEPDPMVVKHWRQDWLYQPSKMQTFIGHRQWQRSPLSAAQAKGKWLQAVYQVDDSPRYAALGSWQHTANFSSWSSEQTWRPLPRREFSVRDDYDVLVGTNLHTITPTGWVQEEHNLKVVLNEDGTQAQVLAREVGVARYERITGFDWSPGDSYWERTGPFWRLVREAWHDLFESHPQLTVAKNDRGLPMFMVMFEMAEASIQGEFDAAGTRRAIDKALAPFISP